jgi:hypothetical protein
MSSFLKNTLKRIFSRAFLKRAYLVYNRLKTNTWDKVAYRIEIISSDNFIIQETKNPFMELRIEVSSFDKPVQNKLALWTDLNWTQDQYLLHYHQPGFIESKTGWGISLNKKLIYPSLGFASAPHIHKPNFFETYFKKPRIIRLQKVISLRDTGEENYFHFFNDVLTKLFFLRDHHFPLNDYVVVISEGLFQKEYFQYFLKNSFLMELNLYAQREEWIRFDEAIFCKPFTHTKMYLDEIINLVKPKLMNGDKRLFLTRPPNSLRFIENINEIEKVLNKNNFEIIDTSLLSFGEQIQLFSQCRYLVAIHGAGICNILFRAGKPLSILEIVQPSEYVPFHYIMMSKIYNYNYSVMLGRKGREGGIGGFAVNPEEFDAKLSQLLHIGQ